MIRGLITMNVETGRSPHERRVQARRGREGALALLVSVLVSNTFIGIAQADDDTNTVDEVVVTAQRRSENVQSVPVSIAVFSNQQLSDFRIEGTQDLATYTPGLYASTSQFGDPVFSLRGVGMNNANNNQNPAVTEYIDEVAIPTIAMLGFDMFDLERVEVLKGPQGDLYGRNTTGGAVNFISAKPTQDFTSSIEADVGNFNLKELGFEVGGGVTDTLALRLAGHAISRDGWQTDVATNNEGGYTEYKNAAVDREALRFSALWTPSDNFRALFIGDATFDNSQIPSYQPLGYRNADGTCKVPSVAGFTGGVGCPVYAVPTPTSPQVAVAYGGTDPDLAFGANSTYGDRNNSHIYGGSLKLEWKLEGMQLTSVTGARKMDRSWGSSSGSPYIDQDLGEIEKTKTFSEELRLGSTGDSPLQWLVGGYFSRDDLSNYNMTNYAQNYEVAPLNPTPVFFNTSTAQVNRTEAAFAHVEYAFNSQWKVIAGIRDTHETIDYTYASVVTADFPPEYELTPVPYDHATLSSNGVSGKIGLNYTPAQDMLFYLSVSDGYKSGGFPGDIAFLPYPATQPASAYLPSYGPEKLYAYELGMKSTLLDNSLQLNSSIYYYDWRNFQASTEIPYGTPPNVIEVFSLGNAGNAHIYGLDTDLTWKLTRELSVRGGISLLHAEIVSGTYEGDQPVQSPHASGNVIVRWQAAEPVANVHPFAQADFNYHSGVYFTLPNVAADSQGGYGLLGLTAGLYSADKKWEYSAWGRNVTNKSYIVDAYGANSTFLPDRHLEAEPRTFGLTVRYTY
jgi:iron complex outermembrane receptor protein